MNYFHVIFSTESFMALELVIKKMTFIRITLLKIFIMKKCFLPLFSHYLNL